MVSLAVAIAMVKGRIFFAEFFLTMAAVVFFALSLATQDDPDISLPFAIISLFAFWSYVLLPRPELQTNHAASDTQTLANEDFWDKIRHLVRFFMCIVSLIISNFSPSSWLANTYTVIFAINVIHPFLPRPLSGIELLLNNQSREVNSQMI